MFETNQSSSMFANPFAPSKQSPDDLEQLYQKLESLKSKPQQAQQQVNQPNKRSVFTDITEEMRGASEDERRFIETSKEYVALDNQYKNEFSIFLMEYLGNDFLNSKYGRTPEQILGVIKEKRELYKNKFAENLNEIRGQNSSLAVKNDKLAKTNVELQKQLLEIQKKLETM